jgi:hypothetical protein
MVERNERLYNVCVSLNTLKVVKEDEMGKACSMYRRDEKCI